jgi:type II secretory pathway pseudopilin PulG
MGEMSIAPFHAGPLTPQNERGRARLVLAIALLGIVATLLAYAISPGVRRDVSHAAHSVRGAVGRVLDHDQRTSTAAKGSGPPAK